MDSTQTDSKQTEFEHNQAMATRDRAFRIGGQTATAGTLPVGRSNILAEIPDINSTQPLVRAEEEVATAPPSDGRVISQRLSSRLVLACGILLVAVAVFPFLLSKKKTNETIAPNWNASGNAATATSGQGIAKAPAMQPFEPTPGTPPVAAYEAARPNPPYARAYLQPQPQISTNRPMAIGDPPWPGPTANDAASPALRGRVPSGTIGDPRLADPADYRAGDHADARQGNVGDRREYQQADLRNTPNDPRDQRSDYRTAYPGAGGPQGSPLMPSLDPRAQAGNDAAAQPGVARFQGIIEKPPVHNSQDRTGASLY